MQVPPGWRRYDPEGPEWKFADSAAGLEWATAAELRELYTSWLTEQGRTIPPWFDARDQKPNVSVEG